MGIGHADRSENKNIVGIRSLKQDCLILLLQLRKQRISVRDISTLLKAIVLKIQISRSMDFAP